MRVKLLLFKKKIVNRYDDFINKFLLREKKLSLEKIGRLQLSEAANSTENAAKFAELHFEYDTKAETSPELITFISEKTGKAKVLVAGDLSSYLEQARQFINIGNPYELEGVGVFRKNNSGGYEFSAPQHLTAKDNNRAEKKHAGKDNRKTKKKNSNKNAVMIMALIIIVIITAVLGWGGYNMFFRNKSSSANNNQTTAPPLQTDSSAANPQAGTQPVITGTDSLFYKFIFEVTPSAERAYSRIAQLKTFGDKAEFDSIPAGDTGMIYHLYVKQKILPADMGKIRDSLQKYFQRPITVQAIKN